MFVHRCISMSTLCRGRSILLPRLCASTCFTSRHGRRRKRSFFGGKSLLSGGSVLCLYGPFQREGRHTSQSNKDFDALIRRQDPEWGVRDLDEVSGLADETGFVLLQTHEMPSNNLTIVFRKRD